MLASTKAPNPPLSVGTLVADDIRLFQRRGCTIRYRIWFFVFGYIRQRGPADRSRYIFLDSFPLFHDILLANSFG